MLTASPPPPQGLRPFFPAQRDPPKCLFALYSFQNVFTDSTRDRPLDKPLPFTSHKHTSSLLGSRLAVPHGCSNKRTHRFLGCRLSHCLNSSPELSPPAAAHPAARWLLAGHRPAYLLQRC